MKKPISSPHLRSWNALNDKLRYADEVACKNLLKEELAGRNRPTFVARIKSRIMRVRRLADEKELGV